MRVTEDLSKELYTHEEWPHWTAAATVATFELCFVGFCTSVGKHATKERKEQHERCKLEHDDCSQGGPQ